MITKVLRSLESEQQIHAAMHICLEDRHHNQATT